MAKYKRHNQKQDDVLVSLDKRTVQEIIKMSSETHFTPQQIVRWLTWLGRKTMGRKITIQEGDKQLTISMEEFSKITDKLDLNNMAQVPNSTARTEHPYDINDVDILKDMWENPSEVTATPAPQEPRELAKKSEPESDKDSSEEFPEDFPDYYDSEMVEYLSTQNATQILQKREDTRGRLAIIYTLATFTMFLMGFLVAVLDGLINKISIVDTLMRILPLISGIFLGTLGFVLGYYFRQADEQDSDKK